jgi:Nif-specific regulatory protein
MDRPRILFVDDESSNLTLYEINFGNDYGVVTCTSPNEALTRVKPDAFDVIVSDHRMPEMTGVEFLRRCYELSPNTTRIIISAYSESDILLAAINAGHVHDYVLKPVMSGELKEILDRAVALCERRRRLEHMSAEKEYLEEEIKQRYDFEEIVGVESGLAGVMAQVRRVSLTNSTVLITGESGTGKELIARAIHYNSPRRDRAFIKVNCVALAPGILESELFGHEKGAFSGAIRSRRGRFELADGGSLFLDEIGTVPLEVQTKLLRVLQEREFERVGGNRTLQVDVRLVTATNVDLEQEVASGRFREDLFYRLAVIPIRLPPLRERPADIDLLAHHFVGRFNRQHGKRVSFSPETIQAIRAYHWPGNVRELENVMERAVVLAEGTLIQPVDLNLPAGATAPPPHAPLALPAAQAPLAAAQVALARRPPDGPFDLRAPAAPLSFPLEPGVSVMDSIRREEYEQLLDALRRAHGNKALAARLLEIPRTTLNYRLKKYGIR